MLKCKYMFELIFGTLVNFFISSWIFPLLFLAGVFLLFVYRPVWSIYAVAATVFFSGWFIDLSGSDWARSFPFLSNFNAPVADCLAAISLIVVGINLLFKREKAEKIKFKHWPADTIWYGIFLALSFVSIFFALDRNYSGSIHYWLRSMVFVYLAYVFLLYIVARKDFIIMNILKIWMLVGALASLYGLSSLIFNNPTAEWIRVSPYPILGFAPLGTNHNQLAELLVPIIPIGLYFMYWARNNNKKGVYRFCVWTVVLMLMACLLTLSRAAWISLVMEGLVFFGLYFKKVRAWFTIKKKFIAPLIMVLALVGVYMFSFLIGSTIVTSSNASRVDAARVVFFHLPRSPVFGFGPGMYMNLLSGVKAYVLDYGEPLDAHGFIFKILAEDGLAGLLAFGWFIFASLNFIWQSARGKDDPLSRCLFAGALGVLCFQLFNTEYFSGVMWMPLGVALAHAHLKRETTF